MKQYGAQSDGSFTARLTQPTAYGETEIKYHFYNGKFWGTCTEGFTFEVCSGDLIRLSQFKPWREWAISQWYKNSIKLFNDADKYIKCDIEI